MYKEHNWSDFRIDHLVMSICRNVSCVVGKGCLLCLRTRVFSWQNSVSLCPASFCTTPKARLPCYSPVISWLLLLHFNPLWWKGHLFLVLVLEGLVGLHRTIQLQLLQRYWLELRLGLLWYWMGCLGDEQRSFCHFWDYIQVLHFGFFCWPW